MLAIRPVCENCGKLLPPNSVEAMICSFECTFCSECVKSVLENVCPNCGGGFEKRPIRPAYSLKKYPAHVEKLVRPVDQKLFQAIKELNKDVDPTKR